MGWIYGREADPFVDWDSICTPTELGGLGWVNLGLKNRDMLNKWIWRFGNRRNHLWRRILVEKEGGNNGDLFPNPNRRSRQSLDWRNIVGTLNQVRAEGEVAREGFGVLLGDRDNIAFWTEKWIEDVVLREAFPRIFALAVKKSGSIKECGDWEEGLWQWKIGLRRPLFGWEIEQWEELHGFIRNHLVEDGYENKMICKMTLSGQYLVSSFCRTIMEKTRVASEHWRMVWKGVALFKVEVFC